MKELIEQLTKKAAERMKPIKPSLLIVDRETAHQLYKEVGKIEYQQEPFASIFKSDSEEKFELTLHIIDTPNKMLSIQIL